MEREFGKNPFEKNSEKLKKLTNPYKIYGFDSNILENRAYLNMDNNVLKLEYQINELEEDLMIINDEILAAISLEDTERITFLKKKRRSIGKELKILNEKYLSLGIMPKVTGVISSIFRKKTKRKISLGKKISKFISKYIFSVFSKRLNFSFGLRESLEKLAIINRSVDELISLQIPKGAATDRYNRLTEYIKKANDIHVKITNNINDFSKKQEKNDISGSKLDIKQ